MSQKSHLGQLSEHVREDETYYLNMGPQHPSMHGVLRLLLHLQGETILECKPIIGYAHRAHEKMAEFRNYVMFLPNTSRVDYLSGMISNIAYCQAIEKLCSLDVPERAETIRVIACELNRIQSHLLWFGTFLLDLGGITPFLYCFDDREEILGILDRVTGSRLTYSYGRFGGVTLDVDEVFLQQATAFLKRLRKRFPMYESLVADNVIFRERCDGVGVISKEAAAKYHVTGPSLRAAGVAYDVRKAEPYGGYDRFDFEVPTRTAGDCLARFEVRMAEMEQSCRLVEQAIAKLPEGPIGPPKLIKKLKPPKGEFYFAVETARGSSGVYIVSDGSDTPVKLKLRTPSFSNLSSMPEILAGTEVADTIAIVGSIDVVLPEIDR
ncbi:MAG: NADH-quinone oxidoreductase subunit D [Planctomycetes bacterium]|nr:NADH-quinone oxidoreductase subunit D [Planctomycetota bacterium]